MLESHFPTIARWTRCSGARSTRRSGARWRLSTWWPSDTGDAMQQSLLRLLAVAHTQRLDPLPLVVNLADEHRGGYRRRLRHLARRLADGTPLVEALEQTPDVLRDEETLAIRFATQTGTLEPTYQSLLSNSADALDRPSAIRRQTFIYTFVTLVILLLSVSFLITFIFPTLRLIQQEFDLSQQHPFYATFEAIVVWVTRYTNWLLLVIVIVAFLIWSAPSRRFFRRSLADRWIRSVAEARSGQLLQLLSTTVDAGRPVPAAISTLARYHFDQSVRQKLLFARNEIEQGADVWTSLTEARLLTAAESNAIAQSTSTQSRAWAMRELARWRLHRVMRRSDTRVRFVQPAVTLAFAAAVLLVAGAMIGYLAEIIQSLARVI